MTKNRIKSICAVTVALCTALFSMTTYANAQEKEIIYDRISGPDRYYTANEVSVWVRPKTLILANGTKYADALSASALVKKEDGAIYLTNGKTFDRYLEDKFTRYINTFEKAIIVGGTSSVSTNIEKKLKTYIPNTTRIAGKDRYETSAKIAQHIGNFEKAFVATGSNYADALSAGAISAQTAYPILLTDTNQLSNQVKALIEKNNCETYVLGGKSAVSDKVLNSIENSKRIQGKDRYETNANIIQEFRSIFDTSKAYVASGNTFPDALAGSGLAGKYKNPLILTDTTPSNATEELVKNLGTSNLIALGGTATLKPQTLEKLSGKNITHSNNIKIKDIRKYIEGNKKYFMRKDMAGITYFYDGEYPQNAKLIVELLDNEWTGVTEYDREMSELNNEINICPTNYSGMPDETRLKEIKNLLSKIFPSSYNEVFEVMGADKNQERFIEGKRIKVSENNGISIIFQESIYDYQD